MSFKGDENKTALIVSVSRAYTCRGWELYELESKNKNVSIANVHFWARRYFLFWVSSKKIRKCGIFTEKMYNSARKTVWVCLTLSIDSIFFLALHVLFWPKLFHSRWIRSTSCHFLFYHVCNIHMLEIYIAYQCIHIRCIFLSIDWA